MEAHDADGRLICWASPGIVRSALAGGDAWDGGRVDEEEAFLQRCASWAATWHQAPQEAARLGLPRLTREQVAELWQAAPDRCVRQHVPKAEAMSREEQAVQPAGEGMGMVAALVEWFRDRLKMRAE